MTGNELKNKGACGASNTAGFNISKGCAPVLKDIVEIRLTDYDFEYDDTRTFDADYLKSIQAAGNLTILQRIDSLEPQSSDNQLSTTSRGIESLAVAGLYKFRATFNHDVWFNKQMGSLEGDYTKRVEFVDSKGTIFRTQGSTNDTSRGFAASSIIRPLQTFLSGTNAQAQYLDIQLGDKSELDDYPVIIDGSLLDRETREIAPIIEASLSFNAIPKDGDTSISIKAVYDRGQKGEVKGLTASGDFAVYINGTLQGAAVGATLTNIYNIPTASLVQGTKIEVSLNGVRSVIGDGLYTSNSVLETVI